MVKYGRSIRWGSNLKDEVEFSVANGFDLMQIWYYKGSLQLDNIDGPKEIYLKKFDFPVIIHALLDINEFEEHVPKILKIIKYLGHNEIIIHPVCISEDINSNSIVKLAEKVKFANQIFSDEGILLMLENNSKLDPIHYKTEEIEYMFSQNPSLELLLDVAHIDSYEHLKDIINVKMPRMLHIADKHFNTVHEHLPINKGEVDFNYIFTEILKDFDGKVILEIQGEDEVIIKSKQIIHSILG